jgi:hypothetical protein
MLIALNILLAAAVVSGMVGLFVHAIRSERRQHANRSERTTTSSWRREGGFSASRG